MKIKLKKYGYSPFHLLHLVMLLIVLIIGSYKNIIAFYNNELKLEIFLLFGILPVIISFFITRALLLNYFARKIELSIQNNRFTIKKWLYETELNIENIEVLVLIFPLKLEFNSNFKNQDFLKMFQEIKDAQKDVFGVNRGVDLKIITDKATLYLKKIETNQLDSILNLCSKLHEINNKIKLKKR